MMSKQSESQNSSSNEEAFHEDFEVHESELRRFLKPYPVDTITGQPYPSRDSANERTQEQEVTTQAELLEVQQQHKTFLEQLNRKIGSICMVQSSAYKLQQNQQLKLREVENINLELETELKFCRTELINANLELKSELKSCRSELRSLRFELNNCRSDLRTNLLTVISSISSKIDFRFIYYGIGILIAFMFAVIILIIWPLK